MGTMDRRIKPETQPNRTRPETGGSMNTKRGHYRKQEGQGSGRVHRGRGVVKEKALARDEDV